MLANPDNKVNLGFLLIISCSILLILSNHVVSFKTDLLTGFTGSTGLSFAGHVVRHLSASVGGYKLFSPQTGKAAFIRKNMCQAST